MPAKVFSAAVLGLESELVEVEVDVLGAGLHHFTLVGLPDTTIKESRDRVSSALKNSGFRPPHHCGRITVNLAPADLPKNSSLYDMPIAVGFLLATEQIHFDHHRKLFAGELALDGKTRPIHGILPIALLAQTIGFEEIYVPRENSAEAALVSGVRVFPVDYLTQLTEHLSGRVPIEPVTAASAPAVPATEFLLDMREIKGQEHAKRALEIAAAGGHNILLSGPPGSGKTLLAKSFPSLLPPPTFEESLEITKIFSVAGQLKINESLITTRPFRAPHHSASAVALVGGGTIPRPGEISLAHRGVLFLDEFGEFPKVVLEHLRQPLEDGSITVSRAKGTLRFPARFTLIAAMNPCPCGNLSDPQRLCSCAPTTVAKYRQRISGPILDRIDLHIEVPRLGFDKLEDPSSTREGSESIRARVHQARDIQMERFAALPILTNSEMGPKHLETFCPLDAACQAVLRQAVTAMQLSARSYHRLIKVARTIADLAQAESIQTNHITEAIQYRFKTE